MNTRPDEEAVDTPIEARAFELGEEYLDQLHAGESSSAASLIALHPELVPYLETHLALVEVLFRGGGS